MYTTKLLLSRESSEVDHFTMTGCAVKCQEDGLGAEEEESLFRYMPKG